MASKCNSKVNRSRPPSLSSNSLDYSLETRSITASKCISKLAQLWPPSAYLHTRLITASTSASLISLVYVLQVSTIMPSKCIYRLALPRSRIVCPNTLAYHLQLHLDTYSITPWEWVSGFTCSSVSGTAWIALEHRLQPVQIYRV